MTAIDWIVTGTTLLFIILYGTWKSRKTRTIETFLLADRQLPWYHVALSVMATQASAITFLSGPGQAYSDGLRFIQFYFGLPLAMIIICTAFIPIFHKLNVYTAYEYLEKRFDIRTRVFTAFLFLFQRGLSTGITIYAPAIVLSTVLHIDLTYTIIFNGIVVIFYTVYGGTKAVSYTQVIQMIIIFSGLLLAAFMVLHYLPEEVGFSDTLNLAGELGKMNAVDFRFDPDEKYNLWSGLIGGFFLQLSYFGTDQSQVGRYLTGSSVKQSRLGLIMNGLVKIPMQLFILMIGILIFAFYQFHPAPVHFNSIALRDLPADSVAFWNSEHSALESRKHAHALDFVRVSRDGSEAQIAAAARIVKDDVTRERSLRDRVSAMVKKQNPTTDGSDSNYIFLHFVTHQLPLGVTGLLVAIIFLAAMGSTASGLNSLASTTIIDFYKRVYKKDAVHEYLPASRLATVLWGLFCMCVAVFAGRLGNLIEAVNVLGSLFYGTILGIFLVAFYFRSVGGNAVFYAAISTEVLVIIAAVFKWMAFLWLNVLGSISVVILALLLSSVMRQKEKVRS